MDSDILHNILFVAVRTGDFCLDTMFSGFESDVVFTFLSIYIPFFGLYILAVRQMEQYGILRTVDWNRLLDAWVVEPFPLGSNRECMLYFVGLFRCVTR